MPYMSMSCRAYRHIFPCLAGVAGMLLPLILTGAEALGAEAEAPVMPKIRIELPDAAGVKSSLGEGGESGPQAQSPQRLEIRAGGSDLVVMQGVVGQGGKEDEKKDKPELVEGPALCSVEVSPYNTVNIHAQNVQISTVLQELAVKSRKNIILAAGADRVVSMTLYSVPFYEALKVILDVNGLSYCEDDDFIQVYTKEQLLRKVQGKNGMASRVFRLNYLRPKDAKIAAEELLSKDGRCKAIEDDKPVDKDTDMSMDKAKKQDPVYQPETDRFALNSALVVYDYVENVEAIDKLLQKLDRRPQQVLLEATVLEVTLTENNSFGVDFAMLNKTNMLDFFNFGGGIPLQGASRSSMHGGLISQLAKDANGVQSSFRGGIAIEDYNVFIQALDQISDVNILSRPKVLSLDRQRARVLVGENVGYLETSFSNDQIVQSVKFIESGISLDVRPYVMDGGKIRLVISPKVSKVIFNTVTIQNGVQQQIPTEKIQTVAADILVPQGATAVIGGLFQEKTQIDRSQIPVLGDIPLLGLGGRRQADTNLRTELVFLIRPTLLGDEELEDIGKETADSYTQVLAGHRQGLLLWSRIRQCSHLNLKASRYLRSEQNLLSEWMYRRSLQLRKAQPEVTERMEGLALHNSPQPTTGGVLYENIRGEINRQEARSGKAVTPSSATAAQEPEVAPRAALIPAINAVAAADLASAEQEINELTGEVSLLEIVLPEIPEKEAAIADTSRR